MVQQYALDVNGNRVFIEKASTMNDYFCEACNCKMIVKKGDIRAHHFAHAASAKCTDSWHYDDMSIWHRNWQYRFPEQCREVYKEYRGAKHRADILFEKNKTVIEFQHSNLSAEEFKKRNTFYRGLGYRVVWLFDLVEHFENENFIFEKNERVYWNRPLKTFKDFILEDNGIELFFQIEYPADENEFVQSIKEIGMSDAFGSESEQYFFKHKNDKGKIIRVAKIATDGIGYFYTDQDIHSVDSWIQKVTNMKSFEPVSRFGTIQELWKKHNCSRVAIFKNTDSGNYAKITSDPNVCRGNCQGYLSKDRYNFKNTKREIYYSNKPVWIFVWSPEKV